MHSTWYLSVEWQLTIIAPIFIYIIWKHGTKGVTLVLIIALLSSYGGVLINYLNNFIVRDMDL